MRLMKRVTTELFEVNESEGLGEVGDAEASATAKPVQTAVPCNDGEDHLGDEGDLGDVEEHEPVREACRPGPKARR